MNYESYRRLWKMFFPHLTETCGVNLIQDLLALHQKRSANLA